MNLIYKLVWSLRLQRWVICSENSRSKSKRARNKNITRLVIATALNVFSIYSIAVADQLCYAVKSNLQPENPVISNNGSNNDSGYLQNAQIVCTASGNVTLGQGGSNGYSVANNNPIISRDTSMVERWTNAGNELNGTIGVTVNEGVTLTAPEDSGLARGILYVRGGYYRNYSNRGNGQETAEFAFKGKNTYTEGKLLKVHIINDGTVINSAKPIPSNHSNPAAIGVDFGDMPIEVLIQNNGSLSSTGANTISVVSYQTVPRYFFWGETGYSLLGLEQYKYSANNTYNIINTGNIVQSGNASHTEGTEFNGAISIGSASAKEVHINNSGSITAETYGINATLSSHVVDSSIVNSGTITSTAEDGIYLNSKTFSEQGFGTPAATDYVSSVTLDSTLHLLENTGTISGYIDGIDNEGVIGTLNNYGTIVGTTKYSIKTDDGTVEKGINNFGILDGDVALGKNTLNLLSSANAVSAQPKISGDIIGTNGSMIVIGNGSTATSFVNTDTKSASVSHITISENSVLTLNEGSVWMATSANADAFKVSGAYSSNGSTTLAGNVLSTGLIKMIDRSATSASILTITGNYHGNGGVLILNTDLHDDNSLTDKLAIIGSATGSTELQVRNVNGKGAQTINGIHVIQTGSSESAKTFYLDGSYVSAGAYDYSLHLREANTNKNNTIYDNWYLESKLHDDPEGLQPRPYTPNVGSYIANEMMGNTLFTSRLEDREGAARYQATDGQKSNFWMRAYGGHNKFNSMSGQLKVDGNSFVTQMGASLFTFGRQDEYNFGVMGGYAHYKGNSISRLTNRKSTTKIDGFSLGLYGTWYENPIEQTGFYIDSWVLWNSFKNTVNTADKKNTKYDSSGITASIEVGNNYLFNQFGDKNWWIQPQAQVIYQGVHADDFHDVQNVRVTHGSDNIQARIGFKTYLEIPTGNGGENYRPYLALNYIHNTNPYTVKINNLEYTAHGSQNLGEIKIGLEGKITKNSQVWINASYTKGKSSNRSYQGNIGWKYNF